MSVRPSQCACGIERIPVEDAGECGNPLDHMYCTACFTCRACARYYPAPRAWSHGVSPDGAACRELLEGLSDYEVFTGQVPSGE